MSMYLRQLLSTQTLSLHQRLTLLQLLLQVGLAHLGIVVGFNLSDRHLTGKIRLLDIQLRL